MKDQVKEWLASQEKQLIQLAADLVNIDSNSYDQSGVMRVFERLEQFFNGHDIPVQWHTHDGKRNAISVQLPGQVRDERPVLLMGHCDTVHPTGDAKTRPFSIEGFRGYGPGVADMKAGVAMNAFIVAAYKQLGGAPNPLYALFTCDEEIGSPTSRTVIEAYARKATYVLNAEPGRPEGQVVTERRGGVFMEITVTGKAAHSGSNFTKGASAIHELAKKINRISALTDLDRGITVNIGLVSGGVSVNTVSPQAQCSVDLRITNLEDRDRIVQRIESITQHCDVGGTHASLRIIGEFRPMQKTEQSMALFHLYQETAKEIGIDIQEFFAGGCADSGITSSMGCATVCATGPVGGHTHTKEEYVELNTFVPRAQIAAAVIAQLD